MKIKNAFIFLLIIFFACTSKPDTPEKKDVKKTGCLSFNIPGFAVFDEKSAYGFRYDYMLIEKNKSYMESDFIIAIRHKDKQPGETLSLFTESDQSQLKRSVSPVYEKAWEPAGFKEKNIMFIAYEFNYFYRSEKIYQRSVYLECGSAFYIISLSSKKSDEVGLQKFEEFWKGIKVERAVP